MKARQVTITSNAADETPLCAFPSGLTVPLTKEAGDTLRAQLSTRATAIPADVLLVEQAGGMISEATSATESFGILDHTIRTAIGRREEVRTTRLERVRTRITKETDTIEGLEEQRRTHFDTHATSMAKTGLDCPKATVRAVRNAVYKSLGLPTSEEEGETPDQDRVFAVPAHLRDEISTHFPDLPPQPGNWTPGTFQSILRPPVFDDRTEDTPRNDAWKNLLIIPVFILLSGLYAFTFGRLLELISRMEAAKPGALIQNPKFWVLWVVGAGMLGLAGWVAQQAGRKKAEARSDASLWHIFYVISVIADGVISTAGIAKAIAAQSSLSIAQGAAGAPWWVYVFAPIGGFAITFPFLLLKWHAGQMEGERITKQDQKQQERDRKIRDFEDAQQRERDDFNTAESDRHQAYLEQHEAYGQALLRRQEVAEEDQEANHDRLEQIAQAEREFNEETDQLREVRRQAAATPADEDPRMVRATRLLSTDLLVLAITACTHLERIEVELAERQETLNALRQEENDLLEPASISTEEKDELVASYVHAANKAGEVYRLITK